MAAKKKLLDLGDGVLRYDFECYLEAACASGTSIIRKAIRQFIDQSLRDNEGIRRDFEALRAQRLAQGENNVSVLPRGSSKPAARKESSGKRREPPAA